MNNVTEGVLEESFDNTEESSSPSVVYYGGGQRYEIDEMKDHQLVLAWYDLMQREGRHAAVIQSHHESLATLRQVRSAIEHSCVKRDVGLGTEKEFQVSPL